MLALRKGSFLMSFALVSLSFDHNTPIPALYTCEGKNISPPLSWNSPPAGTKSLALIMDDPDAPDPAAPKMTWVHWVLYNLPPAAGSLPEGVPDAALPADTRIGINDRKHAGYTGPCPPVGTHRYFHKLYALGTVLPDLNVPTKMALEKAMKGHILAHSELIGLYRRQHVSE